MFGIDISPIAFIANYLLVSGFDKKRDNLINYDTLIKYAMQLEQDHNECFVSISRTDVKWVSELTNNNIKLCGDVILCRSDQYNYLNNFFEPKLATWFENNKID